MVQSEIKLSQILFILSPKHKNIQLKNNHRKEQATKGKHDALYNQRFSIRLHCKITLLFDLLNVTVIFVQIEDFVVLNVH